MASYTDKYKQKRSLNALNLDAEALGMSKEFFPKGVWEMYFEGKDPEGESCVPSQGVSEVLGS